MNCQNIFMKVLLCIFFLFLSNNAFAFWVVNFGTADTLKPKNFGFAAGFGGQVVSVGSPRKESINLMIPHAGFRYGILENLDGGIRLAPVPVPFSTVGPGFGVNLDLKLRLSPRTASKQFAIIGGLGGAHIAIDNKNKTAWSPNIAGLVSFKVNEKTTPL